MGDGRQYERRGHDMVGWGERGSGEGRTRLEMRERWRKKDNERKEGKKGKRKGVREIWGKEKQKGRERTNERERGKG